MASRTQLRLEQLTGSFSATSGINDQITAAATGSINAGSLQDILSHMAGAIKRVHGGDSFSEASSGVLSGSAYIIDYGGVESANTFKLKEDDGTERMAISDAVHSFTGPNGNILMRLLDNDVRIDAGTNGNIYLGSTTGDSITFSGRIANTTNIVPNTDGGSDLGTDSLRFGTTYTDALTVTNNVTIGGNLTVSGDTTTINTTNLNVEDSIIGLGFSGSNPSTLGDRGLLFGRAVTGQAIPGFWYDGATSDFHLATSITDPSSGSFGTTSAYQNLSVGNVAVYSIATEVGSLTVDVDGNFALSGSDGGDISLESSGLNIFLKSTETEYGKINMDIDLVLSSSAGKSLILDSNSGKITLGKEQDNVGLDAKRMGLFISGSGTDESLRLATSDKAYADATGDGGNYLVDFNASSNYNNSYLGLSGSLRLVEDGKTGKYIEFKAPSIGGGSSTTYTFPAQPTNNYFLRTNDSGVLEWADAATAVSNNIAKAVFVVKPGVTITAGIDGLQLTGSFVNGNDSEHFALVDANHEGDIRSDVSTLSDAEMFKKLEVYVNGQLLTSGASDVNGVSSGDYAIVSRSANSLSGSFAFNLEQDDIVTLIRRN